MFATFVPSNFFLNIEGSESEWISIDFICLFECQ